ncbi:hypothetical protein FH972_021570 [Carpinus fangiana]|uniref:EngB-type G domain-containing protein n=1 Tax=Carpinus fangiana TaxID=176857 RepID=A0A5N6KPP1_9ROSI|nr:hypothetical protein FH972_021570 [Carpinus fangiana]
MATVRARPSMRRAGYICASCQRQHTATLPPRRAASTATSSTPSTSPTPPPSQPSFASYTQLTPPTPAQLAHAATFFQHPPAPPTHLFSSARFRSLPPSVVPEVSFLGRSNVGKSSLLNALMHRTAGPGLAFTSAKPGRTRALNAFAVGGDVHAVEKGMQGQKVRGPRGETEDLGGGKRYERWVGRGGIVVLDMPGYGKGSREEWGREVLKYLKARQQLRRTFVLIDAEHGPKTTDEDLLLMLRQEGIVHQIILTKIDKVLFPNNKQTPESLTRNMPKLEALADEMRELAMPRSERGLKALGDVLMCSSEKAWPSGGPKKMGIDGVRWAALQAVGLGCDADGGKMAPLEMPILAEMDYATGDGKGNISSSTRR